MKKKEKLLECLRNTFCSGDNKEKAKRYEVYKDKLQELLRYVQRNPLEEEKEAKRKHERDQYSKMSEKQIHVNTCNITKYISYNQMLTIGEI